MAKQSGAKDVDALGYTGQLMLAELLTLDTPLRQAILARSDSTALEAAADRFGRKTIQVAADEAIGNGFDHF